MFEMLDNKKTLIVVYKDELLVNQLRKMVETKDDTDKGEVIGTADDSINIVSWTEKVWLGNKKAGNIKDKVLFLGEVKGTEELIPVLDIKFNENGVKYGWAGNQAVLYAEIKEMDSRNAYTDFIKIIADYPIPDKIKEPQNLKLDDSEEHQENDKETITDEKNTSDDSKFGRAIIKKAKKVIENSAEAVGKASSIVAEKAEDLFRDKNAVKRQMLFYGVVNLYRKDLEKFMNS